MSGLTVTITETSLITSATFFVPLQLGSIPMVMLSTSPMRDVEMRACTGHRVTTDRKLPGAQSSRHEGYDEEPARRTRWPPRGIQESRQCMSARASV
jgi:hypothetical protein